MKHGLFAEQRRSHVYRMAVAYAVVGWLLVEVATQVFSLFQVPDWSIRLLVLLVVAGFPVAIILAWAYEIKPDCARHTDPADSPVARAQEQNHKVGRTVDFISIGVLAQALILAMWHPWSSQSPTLAVASNTSTASSKLVAFGSVPGKTASPASVAPF